MLPLRWVVSGRLPTYRPKVDLQIYRVSSLRWAVSGRMPTYQPKVASTCNLPYFPYPTLILTVPVHFWDGGSSTGMPPIHFCIKTVDLPYTSVPLPYTPVDLPYTPVALPYTFCKPPLHFLYTFLRLRCLYLSLTLIFSH